ncbi:beta(1,3)galactosyltransferase EpsH [Mobilitalea sibirica]|uniref:Beta(1,3)galactosyltransferase EpsH n=1 Tax=Mobilitalea sibirica TaxID=1462919 RepID=A0A8J7HAY0_9FIRM|nr:PssE/Cps14G family polysaccharide biosynthesis glycosyltransferase [Mobilitalea sibirica]MBH1939367.1 beta(1,3)galactosyltransferase EpsH [Mobilitalea sibirica]
MIFVTLGSQKFQFNRLLIAIDKLVQNNLITDKVFAQIGFSDYIPKNFEFTQFLNRDKFIETLNNCNIVITHGGTGTIITAVKLGKKVIGVPRLVKYSEHVDDHQIQIIDQFDNMGLICGCIDCDLESKLSSLASRNFKLYQSNTFTIIKAIDSFIKNLG